MAFQCGLQSSIAHILSVSILIISIGVVGSFRKSSLKYCIMCTILKWLGSRKGAYPY